MWTLESFGAAARFWSYNVVASRMRFLRFAVGKLVITNSIQRHRVREDLDLQVLTLVLRIILDLGRRDSNKICLNSRRITRERQLD